MFKELNQALMQPTAGAVYTITRQKIVQIAHLMVLGVLEAEGTGGVIDVLERSAHNMLEQKTVTPNGYCDNSAKMGEQYCFLTNGILDANTKRFSYQAFLNFVDNIVSEDGVDSAVEQLREKIEAGELVRIYEISDQHGVWRQDKKIAKFVKNLDILRTLMRLNDIGKDADGGRVIMPFIPVYGLDLYDEFDFREFTEACSARALRRSSASEYYKLRGITVDVWNNGIWDERGLLLVKDASGQLKPATTNDKEVRQSEEGEVKEWTDMSLTDPVKEFPYLERATYQGVINEMASRNMPDRIKMFRCLFEQTIVSFKIALKSAIEAHPNDWEAYMMLSDTVRRLPDILVASILYKMPLTDDQAINLYRPDNIPHRYRRILAHRFGKEKLQDFLSHLLKVKIPDVLRRFVAQKEADGKKLSHDQIILLVEFMKSIKGDLESIDLEEYCQQRAEEIKEGKTVKGVKNTESTSEATEDSKDSAEKHDEDASEEEKKDMTRGGQAGQNAVKDSVALPEFMFDAAVQAAMALYNEKGKADQEKRAKRNKKGNKKGKNGQGNKGNKGE